MQQRASETRATVLHAAATVFERRGYASATIAEILSEGGVTKGAAYFHFESKEALARAIVSEQSVWRPPHTTASDSPFQQLVDTSYAFATALQTDVLARASIRLTLERNTFTHHPDETDQYRAWLDYAQLVLGAAHDDGELAIAPGPAAHIIISSITGTQLLSEVFTGRRDLTERIHTLWTTLAPGVIAPDHRARIDLRPPLRRTR